MDGLLLYLLAAVLLGFSQMWVQSAYNKYAKVPNDSGLTGADVARRILEENDIYDVDVLTSQGGVLSDHYDPRNKTVNLSPDVYGGHSIASIAVAAHEVGHAMQHHQGYQAIAVRNGLLPLAQIGSVLGWGALMIGLASEISGLTLIGLIAVGAVALFQLVTLPVEFNASTRAKQQLTALNIADSSEMSGIKKVLTAAAFTYLAAFLSTILQVLRLLAMTSSRRRD